eukprot:TRINITY_DN20638_c0_g1_i1.p1 TRINITY_DN20638_c0_g1~~TRINITY_DN20638_c0_g1_i1.p1  ORF type:complete len:259 (+),score=41.89 TRINITY_DN20638_c0_g1_i1:44-820(+)
MNPQEEKYLYVSQWCNDLGVAILPEHELSPPDVDRLYAWAREEESLDRIDNELRKKLHDVESETKIINTALATLQLEDLIQGRTVKETASVGAKLGVKQLDAIIITSAMSDLRTEIDDGEAELEDLIEQHTTAKQRLVELNQVATSFDNLEHMWSEDVSRREADAASNEIKTSTHLEKVAEYQHRLSKMQSQSVQLGMSSQLTHASLVSLFDEFLANADKLASMQSKVANRKLPPNISKARAAVMELEAEVKNLQRRR